MDHCLFLSALGQLETFPALSRMSAPGGKADEISTKADVGLECRLLGVNRTKSGAKQTLPLIGPLSGVGSRTGGMAQNGACSCERTFGKLMKRRLKDYRTEFFRVRPALKRTDLDALILMASPVRGFRPLRAPRFETVKVPNPAN